MDNWFSRPEVRLTAIIVGVVLAVLVVLDLLDQSSSERKERATIDITGVAEIVTVPDVGTFTFTVEAEADDVAGAQVSVTKAMDNIMSYLREEGQVAKVDIKTQSYNAWPRHEWRVPVTCLKDNCARERVIVAYVVSQTVTVKVRDIARAGTLIGGVGQRGATNLSGLSFTVDDIEAVKEQARLAAIVDAKAKAKRVAKELDVRLGDVRYFSAGASYGNNSPVYQKTRGTAEFSLSTNVAFDATPDITVGENTVTAHVTITYEIK